jgi:mannonate dehydratase
MRGGVDSRSFHLDKPSKGHWNGKIYEGSLTHGREYSEEEIWDNFEYFIKKITPVAEEAGVYIGMHPDDPPVYPLGGIPRCVLGTFEGYKRAVAMADSPHIGVCLCVGCWLEGGELMGADVLEALRYFGERKKLFKVHFRNVSRPIPEGGFAETFIDDGYMDMSKIINLLHEIDYDGCVMSDHLPKMIGGDRAAEALSVGYIRGLIHSAQGK